MLWLNILLLLVASLNIVLCAAEPSVNKVDCGGGKTTIKCSDCAAKCEGECAKAVSGECQPKYHKNQFFIRNVDNQKAHLYQSRKPSVGAKTCHVHYFFNEGRVMGGKGLLNRESCLLTIDVNQEQAFGDAGSLWEFESSEGGPYYYIRNARYSDFRLYIKPKRGELGMTKEKLDPTDLSDSEGHKLWRLLPLPGTTFIYIQNKQYPNMRINLFDVKNKKPGVLVCKGACTGGYPRWTLVPRYTASSGPIDLKTQENPSNEPEDMWVEIYEGVQKSSEESVSTERGLKLAFEFALKPIEKLGFDVHYTETYLKTIGTEEKEYTKQRITPTIPAFMSLTIKQKRIHFKGVIDPDYDVWQKKYTKKCTCLKKYKKRCRKYIKKNGKRPGEC